MSSEIRDHLLRDAGQATAAPEGTPFHIIAERSSPGLPRQDGMDGAPVPARVELVNGAVIWYTTTQEIGVPTDRPPAME